VFGLNALYCPSVRDCGRDFGAIPYDASIEKEVRDVVFGKSSYAIHIEISK